MDILIMITEGMMSQQYIQTLQTQTNKQKSHMSYIPLDKKYTLTEFKYSGGTDSITYQYLWSPFADYLLKFFPEWVAPNLITLSALLLLVFVNIVFMLPDENDILPNWKLYMMAVSIFMYQHLDNIDGKQARRTKSASPLGMLFDHGSDAITAFLLAIQVLKILRIQFTLQLFCVYIFIMSTYFCAMWSQYCVGYFKLGRVNPVDQGLPTYSIACLIATQLDLSKVHSYHWVGTYGQEVIYFMCILLLPQIVYMSKDIINKRIVPLSVVVFMTLLYFSGGVAIYAVVASVPELNASVHYAFYYALMFFWSRNMINIQLYHITKQKYRVFNRGTLSFLGLIAFYVIVTKTGVLQISAEKYFLFVCGVQAVIFFQFVTKVLNQGADILGIKLFKLPKKNKVN